MSIQFKDEWITNGATQEMVDFAKEKGELMADKQVSPSQFRNIYGEIVRIKSIGFARGESSFYLLQPKMAYAIGRSRDKGQQGVKDTSTDGLKELQKVITQASPIVKDDNTLLNFCNLIEAILAFHKQKTVENKMQNDENKGYSTNNRNYNKRY